MGTLRRIVVFGLLSTAVSLCLDAAAATGLDRVGLCCSAFTILLCATYVLIGGQR